MNNQRVASGEKAKGWLLFECVIKALALLPNSCFALIRETSNIDQIEAIDKETVVRKEWWSMMSFKRLFICNICKDWKTQLS